MILTINAISDGITSEHFKAVIEAGHKKGLTTFQICKKPGGGHYIRSYNPDRPLSKKELQNRVAFAERQKVGA